VGAKLTVMRFIRSQHGQAAVELVAMLPVIVLVAGSVWQVAVAGQALWLVGSAARAAARAHAVGLDPEAAARSALPARLERGVRVRTARDGSVTVVVPVPAVLGPARLGTVDARARFEPQS